MFFGCPRAIWRLGEEVNGGLALTEQRIAAEAVDRTAYGSGHNAFLSGSVSDFATREQPRFGQRIVTASVRTGGVYYDV